MATHENRKRKGTARPTCLGNKFALGNKGGRPRKWTEEAIAKETAALHEWMENPNNYFFTSFLAARGLHPQQMERFAAESEEFRETHARARATQEFRIVDKALNRKFDATFAKFVLSNKAGWKEKQEISGDGKNPLAALFDEIGQKAKDHK